MANFRFPKTPLIPGLVIAAGIGGSLFLSKWRAQNVADKVNVLEKETLTKTTFEKPNNVEKKDEAVDEKPSSKIRFSPDSKNDPYQ